MTGRSASVIAEDVHVNYRAYTAGSPGLRDLFTRVARRRNFDVVQAVRGVSFTLYEGQTVGVIGDNGSGKSTLLSALTGLLPLESGRIRVISRPRLLGVGRALRGAVSGRDNIVIGGLALGLALKQVERRSDDVVDFADIGDAIDRPMNTYSAGERARLNFGIATMSAPDILLVDEATVVGDTRFRAKAAERIAQIRAASGTVVLVTHNLDEIIESCDRVIWLHQGKVVADGPVDLVCGAYGLFGEVEIEPSEALRRQAATIALRNEEETLAEMEEQLREDGGSDA